MNSPAGSTHQEFLLTISGGKEGIIENALPGVHVQPLFLDAQNGTWVIYVKFEPGTVLPRHFHTGAVHFYTTRGRWNYVEYPDEPQTEGSYLYEPGGSVHTLMVPADAKECAEGFVVNLGANVDFLPNGEFLHIMDAAWIENRVHAACAEQGREVPRYIRTGNAAGFSDR